VKKARASPKLNHEHTCHKLTVKFLTETNIKRLIAVRNKNKIARNKMKNERNQMYRKEKGKENLQRLPRSRGCPTNPFHPSFFKI
jgi:hypothetical protein